MWCPLRQSSPANPEYCRGRKPGRQTVRWKKVEEKETSLPKSWLYLEEKTAAIWQIMKEIKYSHFCLLQSYSYLHSMQHVHCVNSMWILLHSKLHRIQHSIILYCNIPQSTVLNIHSFMNKSEVLWALIFNATFGLIIRSDCQKLHFSHKNLT